MRLVPAASAHIVEQRTCLSGWSEVSNTEHVAPMSLKAHATLLCRSLPPPAC